MCTTSTLLSEDLYFILLKSEDLIVNAQWMKVNKVSAQMVTEVNSCHYWLAMIPVMKFQSEDPVELLLTCSFWTYLQQCLAVIS